MKYYNYGFISLEELNTKFSSNNKILAHVTGSYFTITKFSISTLNCMKSSG